MAPISQSCKDNQPHLQVVLGQEDQQGLAAQAIHRRRLHVRLHRGLGEEGEVGRELRGGLGQRRRVRACVPHSCIGQCVMQAASGNS